MNRKFKFFCVHKMVKLNIVFVYSFEFCSRTENFEMGFTERDRLVKMYIMIGKSSRHHRFSLTSRPTRCRCFTRTDRKRILLRADGMNISADGRIITTAIHVVNNRVVRRRRPHHRPYRRRRRHCSNNNNNNNATITQRRASRPTKNNVKCRRPNT